MDIIIFGIIVLLLFVMSFLNNRFSLLGLVAGIGLIMMALLVYTGDLQMQTGTIENVHTELNMTNITAVYSNVSDVLGGATWIKTVVSIVFGAAGLLIFLGAIYKINIK